MSGRAIVVGSGPNGLAAALRLAEQGMRVTVHEAAPTIGGGMRTSELTLPGVLHDDCSAFHPLGVGSPAFRSFRLEEHGLEWLWPEVGLAHPLDGGGAAVLYRSVDETADALGPDGRAWRRLFAPVVRSIDHLLDDVLAPLLHVPRHPITLAAYGTRALLPATVIASRWRQPEARALFAGSAAHLIGPLTAPLSGAIGIILIAAAHAYGWPVAKGGSQAIADAMAAKLVSLGGEILTNSPVESVRALGTADVVMLDVAPRHAARLLGDRVPPRTQRAYDRFRHGPAAHKVDFAIRGHIPWVNDACRRAGTVHLSGTLEEIVAVERQMADGTMPERPFCLIGQQYLADPSRSAGDINPIWAYAHVPHAYPGDATEAIIRQIERYAPGFRSQIVATHVRTPADLEAHNPNYVGGDISAGANTPVQILMRPRWGVRPYDTGAPGVFLCSSSTPPGAGVHGMCGLHAAERALALRP